MSEILLSFISSFISSKFKIEEWNISIESLLLSLVIDNLLFSFLLKELDLFSLYSFNSFFIVYFLLVPHYILLEDLHTSFYN